MMQSLRDVHEDATSSTSGDPLSIYTYNEQKNRWTRTSYARHPGSTDGSLINSYSTTSPSRVRILTWNVDFFSPNASERLKCILSYIQCTLFSCHEEKHAPESCIILFQEVEAEVLPLLLASTWLRAHFQVTPISNFNWPNRSHYGCVMLVSKDIGIIRARNLIFKGSHQSRAALIMDILLSAPREDETEINKFIEVQYQEESRNLTYRESDEFISSKEAEGSRQHPLAVFRIANVHLESLPQGANERRQQLALIAQALQARDEDKVDNLLGGMVCGDMNSICASDRDLHSEVGLLDAYLLNAASAGAADDDIHDVDGLTWGFQPISTYPPGRLDKVLHTPAPDLSANTGSASFVSFTVDAPTRVGVGLKIEDDQFASSHVGLSTTLTVCTKMCTSRMM